MIDKKLFGFYVALVTPFKADGSLDLVSFASLVNQAKKGKPAGLVIGGGAGEGGSLFLKELDALTGLAIDLGDGIPVIIHVGFLPEPQKLEMAKICARVKVAAVMAIVPNGRPVKKEELVRFYNRLGDCGLPVIPYVFNGLGCFSDAKVEARGNKILVETLASALPEIENLGGVKITDPDFDNVIYLIQNAPPGVPIFSGKDSQFLEALSLGSGGCISGAANILLKPMLRTLGLFSSCDLDQADDLNKKLQQAVGALTRDNNLVNMVKTVLKNQGLIGSNKLRALYAPCDPKLLENISGYLQDLKNN